MHNGFSYPDPTPGANTATLPVSALIPMPVTMPAAYIINSAQLKER